ncbi:MULTISPECIES: hypothetical protein [Streptomyces]|uniref:hypothetical protein n=1 Tax=Streptomyces TaxID=1883 RepID=UPI001B38EA01|nr:MULTISPECIES: hypothetical protein [Streptomyces]MBQ1106448.1 hypothetical protein [Streptomyces sp. 404i]WIY78137.1 hypothetical protein QPM16_22505 [Streptomyces anulatus]
MNAAAAQVRWYVAESHGGDAARSVRLGGILAPTRRLALRWLRRQARRFADALDPDPYALWVPARALHPVPAGGRHDAPAELRSWAASFREHDYALTRLADGLPYEFVARDTASWYGLVMRPLSPSPTPHRQG